MEISTIEIAAVKKAINPSSEDVVDLNELQLALIGGGTGDVSLG